MSENETPVDFVEVGPDYFACRHEGHEAECNWIQQEVRRIFAEDRGGLRPIEITEGNLLSHVVYALAINYGANITSIHADQWVGIAASTYDVELVDGKYKQKEPPDFSTWIQCDDVEDGIAATYVAFYQKYGPEREHNG